ncbi:MAG: ABC transporter ATP-binding protein, partial [Verrucomicrobiales bacterium]|nr:ABC transporter ATP-binding protein [Verrucomicrobiales bacterium]
KFEDKVILENLSCRFPAGKISSLVGLSGSGKTTLLRVIAGFENPDCGTVEIDGRCMDSLRPQNRKIGFVFQNTSFYEHLSVQDNLFASLRNLDISDREARERIGRISEQFRIDDLMPRIAGSLSGGEGQRLGLAKAMVRSPKFLLLDEPFGHLDLSLRQDARRFTYDALQELGSSAIVVSHDHVDAQLAGGPIYFLEGGKIVQSGEWNELYDSPRNSVVASVVAFQDPVRLEGEMVENGNSWRFKANALDLEVPVVRERINFRGRGNPRVATAFFRPETIGVGWHRQAMEDSKPWKVVEIYRREERVFATVQNENVSIRGLWVEEELPALKDNAVVQLPPDGPILVEGDLSLQ